jgi:hypothetical protein
MAAVEAGVLKKVSRAARIRNKSLLQTLGRSGMSQL